MSTIMIQHHIKEKLDEIEKIAKQYHETVYSAVSTKEIEYMKEWWSKNCQASKIPDEYLKFISIVDGFDFNGLSFYTINIDKENNFYESNEIYWGNDNLKEYVFWGKDSIYWYCEALGTHKYYVLDKPSASIMEEFSTLEEMLLKSFKSVL